MGKSMASISEKLNQIRCDWEYICNTYGDVEDFTGSGMEDSQLNVLLLSPTKQTAFNCYKERLHNVYEYGYSTGEDRFGVKIKPLPIFEDLRVREIGDRYLLPIPEVD